MTRPTTIAGMEEAAARFATEEGTRRGLAYRPAPSDVFISPYAKCGTTWMQQIVHGLRTGGSMAFGEISEVVPWLECAHDLGQDVTAPQVAAPRAFKSHLAWDAIPKGGRYIVVFRDPADAMVSLYRFFEGWYFEPGSIPLAEFAAWYLHRPESYWDHAGSWWRQRGRGDVLLLSYETMKRDLPGTVDRVAAFIGGGYDRPTRDLATRQAGFDFMKARQAQFDDHFAREQRDAVCGLPPGGESTKVRSGDTGQGAALATPEIAASFAARWHDTMTAEFGLRSYGDLVEALAE